MGIQGWSEDVILVNLTPRPEDQDDLQTAIDMVREKGVCNVVIDFSGVDIAGGATFTRLLELRQTLQDSGHKVVLCGLSPATKGVFSITRLDGVFEFVEDRFAALARVQMMA